MNSMTAFAAGFLLATILVILCALKIGRAVARDARQCGYEDGRDAERSIIRRELAAKAREMEAELRTFTRG